MRTQRLFSGEHFAISCFHFKSPRQSIAGLYRTLIGGVKILAILLMGCFGSLFAQTPIACGQTVTASIQLSSEIDFYSFTVQPGETVRLVTISSRRNFMELLNASGGAVASAENVLQATLPQGGTYRLLVRSIFNSETFDYNLTFQQLKNPCGAAQLNCGQLVSGSITKGSESHLRTIDVTAGEIVRLVMNSDRRNYIELFDANGVSVTAAENVLQTTLQQAGRYTVLVRSIFYSEALGYNLSFQQLKNPCGAAQLNCGQLVSSSITKGSESHLRTIEVAAGEVVRLVMNSDRRNYIELFDANGVSVTAAENVLQTTLQQAGRYTVLVRSIFYSEALGYNLSFQRLKNPCARSATELWPTHF